MSHPEQLSFFQTIAANNAHMIRGAKILEIGSYDVNGNIREMFKGATEYVGVDLVSGPNVDVIGYGHEFDAPQATFDVALSGECFEHDPFWRQTFLNMVRLVRPGGLVAFTCASRGRVEHGTSRTDRSLSPGTQHVGLDYYSNLEESDFASLDLESLFSEYAFWYIPTSMDLYFAGRIRGQGATLAALPGDIEVRKIQTIMTFPHRLARKPLVLLSQILRPDVYQTIARPYWYGLLKLQRFAAKARFERSERTKS